MLQESKRGARTKRDTEQKESKKNERISSEYKSHNEKYYVLLAHISMRSDLNGRKCDL